MITFKQFYITEANTLLFDLINKEDLRKKAWSYSNGNVYGQIFDAEGKVKPDIVVTIDKFNTKISQLFTNEIIAAMNQYGVSNPPKYDRTREGREQQEVDNYLRPYLEDMVCSDIKLYNYFNLFIKLSTLLSDTGKTYAKNKLSRERVARLRAAFEGTGGVKDWMIGSDGKVADNLYLYLPDQPEGNTDQNIENRLINILNKITGVRVRRTGIEFPIQHFYDFINDRRLSPEVAQKTGIRYATDSSGIMGYFMKSPTLHTIGRIAQDYDRFIEITNKSAVMSNIKDNAHEVYAWPDGTRMVQPMTQEFCEYMGKSMKHCVGGYEALTFDTPLLQLISKDDKLVATIELNYWDDAISSVTMWDIDNNAQTDAMPYSVGQIKGKANGPVDSKYKGYLEEFFTKYSHPALSVEDYSKKVEAKLSKQLEPLSIKIQETPNGPIEDIKIMFDYPTNVLHL